jgi:hypothetical protein
MYVSRAAATRHADQKADAHTLPHAGGAVPESLEFGRLFTLPPVPPFGGLFASFVHTILEVLPWLCVPLCEHALGALCKVWELELIAWKTAQRCTRTSSSKCIDAWPRGILQHNRHSEEGTLMPPRSRPGAPSCPHGHDLARPHAPTVTTCDARRGGRRPSHWGSTRAEASCMWRCKPSTTQVCKCGLNDADSRTNVRVQSQSSICMYPLLQTCCNRR